MKQLGTLVFLGLLCTAAPAAAADDILIQWRAFPDPAEACAPGSWPTCYEVRNGVQYQKQNSLSGASDSNDLKYGRRFYAFDGANDYIWIPKITNADTDDGLTVRAWFRPRRLSGRQVVISNTNAGGFSLHLDGTRVVGEVNIAGTYYSVESPTNVVRLGEWNQVTFVVDLDGDDMESSHIGGGANVALLTLIVNGNQSDIVHGLGPVGTNPRIVNSTKHPRLGAEPNASGAPTQWFFKGDIEAVNVRNYPIEWDSDHPDAQLGANKWLTVPPAEDGGIKGGEPSYYDSHLDEASLTVDARFAEPDDPNDPDDVDTYDSDRVNIHSLVPFINDEYIVQGIASTCPDADEDDAADCDDERLFLSLYWRSASGGSPEVPNPSLIVEIDPKEESGGRVLSCRALTGELGDSHVAGLGYHDGMLYVGAGEDGESYAERYELWDATGDLSCSDVEPWGEAIEIEDGGSLSIQDGFLLVSDYAGGSDDPAQLWVHEIQPDGTLLRNQAHYCLPNLIEGVAFVDFGGSEGSEYPGTLDNPGDSSYLVLTQLNDGLIRISATDAMAAYQNGKCPDGLFKLTDSIAVSTKGSQDLALSSVAASPGRVWFANESGSKYYQQNDEAGWPHLFPFVAYVDLQAAYFSE